MAAAEPADPPEGWDVFSEEQDGGVRWAVRRAAQPRPLAWGLSSRRSAVRWAWRLAGPGAKPAKSSATEGEAAASPSRPPHPWWAVKD